MWTPRRILLLLTAMAATVGAYLAYARVLGGIDGLPELPAEYLVSPNAPAPPTLSDKVMLTKEMLKRAFGGGSPEVGNAIAYKLQIYMAAQGQLIACGQPAFAAEPSRFVEVSPFSMASIGKPRAPGDPGPPDEREEITTAHADKAILEFDKPVASAQDMREKCKLVGLQMLSTPDVPSADARRGKVWVTNNQKSADPGQFLVFNTVGPVYYRSPDDNPTASNDVPQMYTNAIVEVIDKRNLPHSLRSGSTATSPLTPEQLRRSSSVAAILRGESDPPPTITAEGMKIYLDRSSGKEPAGAKPDKRNTTGYSGVRLIELSRNVQFNLWTDNASGFPGTNPAEAPAAPAKDAAPAADPPAGLGAVAGAYPDVVALETLYREKKLLVIDTPGSFRFDFAKSLARFDTDGLDTNARVSVHRLSAGSEPDELFCSLLVIQFDGAGDSKAAPTSGVGSGMKIKSLKATGIHVFVSAVAEDLLAQGEELSYTVDAPSRTTVTTLRGKTVSANRSKNSLIAGQGAQAGEILITSVEPPPGSLETKKSILRVNGPGQIDIFDAATKSATVQATWGRSLSQERVRVGDQDQDLLKFEGNAEFLDTKADVRLSATRLLLWLGNRVEPGAATAKPGGTGQSVPQRLDAIGNVASKSPELVITNTNQLRLWFRDVLPPAVKAKSVAAAVAPTPATPQVVAGTPPVTPKPEFKPADGSPAVAGEDPAVAVAPKPKPPIELSAGTIESWMDRYAQPADASKPAVAGAVAPPPGLKYEMQRALCEERVIVHQGPAEPEKVPRGLDIAGVKLNLVASRVNDEIGNVMTVTGSPGAFAEVHFETTSLFGPAIKIDQVNNTVAIDGVGSMLMPSNTDFSGAATERANELEIRFVKSMFFNGAKGTAEFLGLVNAVQRPARDALTPRPATPVRQTVAIGTVAPATADDGAWSKSQLLCHRLDVTFDRPVYFNQFKRDEASSKARDPNDGPKIRKADCTTIPDDELAGNTNPLAKKVTFLEESYTKANVLTKAQLVEGRQIEVRLRDKEKTQEVFATGPGQVRILQADSSEFGKKAATPPPARKPGERAPFKLTLVKYLDTMTAIDKNKLYQSATFRNGANVWQIPTNNVNLPFAAHLAPPGTTALSCNTSLEVTASRPRPDADANQEMVAIGNAEFNDDDYTGHGAQINFESKNITLRGSGQQLARIYPNKRSVNQQTGTSGRKIVYRADGTIENPEAGTGTFLP